MKTISRTICVYFLLSCFLSNTVLPLGAEQPPIKYTEPTEIIDEVSKRGPRDVVFELYSQPALWAVVLQNISTGVESWLKVAVALHPGSDAAASEMLTLAIGAALEYAPEKVFRIALPAFQLRFICDAPDIDDMRYNTYDLAVAAIKKRQDRILTISDSTLMVVGKQCVQFLEESKASVAKFYGIKQ